MKQCCIEISSERNRIKEVEAMMLKANKEFGLTDDQYGKTMIAVTELVMNAIVHGNKEDINKKVCIKVEFDKDEMKVEVILRKDLKSISRKVSEENFYKLLYQPELFAGPF